MMIRAILNFKKPAIKYFTNHNYFQDLGEYEKEQNEI